MHGLPFNTFISRLLTVSGEAYGVVSPWSRLDAPELSIRFTAVDAMLDIGSMRAQPWNKDESSVMRS